MRILNKVKKTFHNKFNYLQIIAVLFIFIGGLFIINLDRNNIYLNIKGIMFIGLLWAVMFTQSLWKKYLMAIAAFIIYLSLVFLYPIQFQVWAQFAFNLPIIFAYLFKEIIAPITTGIILALVFSGYASVDPNIRGAIIGVITMAILSAIAAKLIRILISQKNKYYKMSIRDALTNLYNINHLLKLGQNMVNNDSKIMAIMLDIDNFKDINDTYGHLIGNNILIQISNLLNEKMKQFEGVVGRYGGDEFLVLLKNYSKTKAKKISGDLSKNIHTTKFLADSELDPIYINISIGEAYYNNNNNKTEIEEIIKKADKNMYKNKYKNKLLTRNKINVSNIYEQSLTKKYKNYLNAIADKDMYTYFHSYYTAQWAVKLAKKLNMDNKFINNLFIAGLFHDIGKVLITNDIIRKPHKLTDEEYKIIKQHVKLSLNILKGENFSEVTLNAIKYHHERWNGLGYPYGKKAKEVPIEGRIMGIADAYSAMTIKRVYRKSLTSDAAINELVKNSGTQFDPELVNAFLDLNLKKEFVY